MLSRALPQNALRRAAASSSGSAAHRALSTSASRRQASPAPEQPKMIKLTVNGKEVEVVQGCVMSKCWNGVANGTDRLGSTPRATQIGAHPGL